MKPSIFLDRDGVITADPPHYAHRIDQLTLVPGSAEAIRFLNEQRCNVIVITNQSGVARGIYEENDISIFNSEMKRQLHLSDAHVDAIYYCPHHPEGVVPEYRKECGCRKPKPGMLLQAAKDFQIELLSAIFVGDKASDLLAGKAAGCKTVLVLTGHGKEEFAIGSEYADFIAENLLSAVVKFIIPEYCNYSL